MSVQINPNPSQLQDRINTELQERRTYKLSDSLEQIGSGNRQTTIESLVFFSNPADLKAQFAQIRNDLERHFPSSSSEFRYQSLYFLLDFTIALRSFLPCWNLQNTTLHGTKALDSNAVEAIADEARNLLATLEQDDSTEAANILQVLLTETRERLKAEAAQNPDAAATALAGQSLGMYADKLGDILQSSNLLRLARLRADGLSKTELGNDYAIFLQHTMYTGISFVTSNPVLVDVAWSADPETWTPVFDLVVEANPNADESQLARMATLEVVLSNMRLLRPIFLLTEGKMGYVSLQVNPKIHDDRTTMIADIKSLYRELSDRLANGVPNVVFKLPATQAGLEACEHISALGIGVNITVNFAMFQQLPFAEAIQNGKALASYLTEMNGRLAYPVRDELLTRLDEFKAKGISEDEVRNAAAYAGIAVTKRLHQLLVNRQYDLSKIRPLIASLRWYEGEGYEAIATPCPDVIDCAGVSVITIFPNIRHALDGLPDIEWRPSAIEDEVALKHLQILRESELFKQAFHVSDTTWISDDSDFAPDSSLSLTDEQGTASFIPVSATLGEFGNVYDIFVSRLLARRALLALRANNGNVAPNIDNLHKVLTNSLDTTVVSGLQISLAVEPNIAIGDLLRSEDVRKSIKEIGEPAHQLYTDACSRHLDSQDFAH